MVVLDTISGVLLLAFILTMEHTDTAVLGIGILMCCMAVIQNMYDPSVRAAIPNLIDSQQLAKANSISQLAATISGLAGPVAAGFIYGLCGIKVILIINCISFFAAAFMEIFLIIPYQKKKMNQNPLLSFSKDLVHTLYYINRERKILLYIAYISAGLNFLIMPLYIIGIPYLEKEIFHVTNQMYGISETCIGLGVIAGAVVTGFLSKKLSIQKFHLLFIAIAVIILCMGFSTLPFIIGSKKVSYLAYVILTVTGFLFTMCITVSSIFCVTFIQKVTPTEHMGKVMSLVNAFSTIFLPAGQILYGILYSTIVNMWFLIYGAVALITLLESYLIYNIIHDKKLSDEVKEKFVP
ncbi:Major Facilitator Superfamily protein [Anaeromicropila populeti]|uniref:Major Facilitator Superfamily protein n=2 Tax=Anaeromicropila populeti TaxID=37658 RepID=A0A1I6JBS8_9FIRM|nr:Major Facilitator Superfamily protein [Anaeromicropila populeti]